MTTNKLLEPQTAPKAPPNAPAIPATKSRLFSSFIIQQNKDTIKT